MWLTGDLPKIGNNSNWPGNMRTELGKDGKLVEINRQHTNKTEKKSAALLYQMSDALEIGVWLTISGATNSGVPYLQYWASSGVIIMALPKSHSRI